VGIHERSSREKISHVMNGAAHVMNDEATRKYLQVAFPLNSSHGQTCRPILSPNPVALSCMLIHFCFSRYGLLSTGLYTHWD